MCNLTYEEEGGKKEEEEEEEKLTNFKGFQIRKRGVKKKKKKMKEKNYLYWVERVCSLF